MSVPQDNDPGNVVALFASDVKASQSAASRPLENGNGGGHIGVMENRISRVEGAMDGIKQSQSILIMASVGIFTLLFAAVVAILTFQVFSFQRIQSLETTMTAGFQAIQQQLREDARAMRADMAAQTSAIANSITATKQQTPAAPVIIQVPERAAPGLGVGGNSDQRGGMTR